LTLFAANYLPVDNLILILVCTALIAFLLVAVVYTLGLIFSYKARSDREKIRPFECGFTPKINARMPFSIRFFLLALVFLIFDVELVLIFPYLLVLVSGNLVFSSGVLLCFIIILLLGVFHEWNQGMLD
jgi:NADH-ubiquinone oxidoreductase chain 3